MEYLEKIAVGRIRELRRRHGWTQQQLADRLNQLGAHIDRAAVAKVELEKRRLTLDEAFHYALALDVAPVHLLVPTDGDEPVRLATNLECTPRDARRWIRGEYAMPPYQDARFYHSAVPPEEHRVRGWSDELTEEQD
jgi:transcriptional regulator with XRE-family HTH domain